MERSHVYSWLIVTSTLGSLCLLVGACTVYSIAHPVSWTERIPALNTTYQELAITEYGSAVDVSYGELRAFLANDTTETADYALPAFSCGDFAVRLHDEAERRGIRCGIVIVTLNTTGYMLLADLNGTAEVPGSDRGHAFNVFNTTDHGPVYIDATGISRAEKSRGRQPHKMVVYFEDGKPLGEISIGQAESLDYAYYTGREARYSLYLQDVRAYLDDVEGYERAALAEPKNGTLEFDKQELAARRRTLLEREEAGWIMTRPFGIVERSAAYW